MFDQIVIDCQTQTEHVVCEYCIIKKRCLLRSHLDKSEKKDPEDKTTIIASYFPILVTS